MNIKSGTLFESTFLQNDYNILLQLNIYKPVNYSRQMSPNVFLYILLTYEQVKNSVSLKGFCMLTMFWMFTYKQVKNSTESRNMIGNMESVIAPYLWFLRQALMDM